jgi:acylphosphatase
MPIYEIYVRGRVQGVGFRYHAKETALRHRVTGFVRNMPDRSVYLVVQAEKSIIDSFCESLRVGNGFSRVDDIHIEILDSENRYHDFEIR